MFAFRPGTCRGCHQPFDAGTPIFFDKQEGNWHWPCWESVPQPQWLIDEAEKMGYRRPVEFEDNEKDWSF